MEIDKYKRFKRSTKSYLILYDSYVLPGQGTELLLSVTK